MMTDGRTDRQTKLIALPLAHVIKQHILCYSQYTSTSAVWNVMHEHSNHIQHEGLGLGCMWLIRTSALIPYSTCMGVLTGLHPHSI